MQVFIYCKMTLHVSVLHRTHHQEYIKLYLSNNIPPTWPIGHVGGRLLLRYYDWPRWKKVLLRYYELYHRLQLQFYVLLMMGAMDT